MTRIKGWGIGLLCCSMVYAISSSAKDTFLVISDMHVNTSYQQTMDFTPKHTSVQNDLDVATYKQLIANIKQNIQSGSLTNPQFILLLGDMVGHHRTTSHAVLDSEAIVLSTLKQHFPNTPVFYTFGNNDSFSGNYGPFRAADQSGKVQSPIDSVQSVWQEGGFLSSGKLCTAITQHYPCIIDESKNDGYCAAYLKPKLRVISLNSVMFSKRYMGIKVASQQKQLDWLDLQLRKAHQQHDAVLLMMHIPPGRNVYDASWFWSNTNFWEEAILEPFLTVIRKYHNDIIGILAAHTHKDEFKMIQNAQHHNLVGVYLNAALSTSHGNAPSIRTYELQKIQAQWRLTDYSVYFFKKNGTGTIQLKLLYNYRDTYCQPNEKTINDCLQHVTLKKVQRYFSAGNDNYFEKLKLPENMIISPDSRHKS